MVAHCFFFVLWGFMKTKKCNSNYYLDIFEEFQYCVLQQYGIAHTVWVIPHTIEHFWILIEFFDMVKMYIFPLSRWGFDGFRDICRVWSLALAEKRSESRILCELWQKIQINVTYVGDKQLDRTARIWWKDTKQPHTWQIWCHVILGRNKSKLIKTEKPNYYW